MRNPRITKSRLVALAVLGVVASLAMVLPRFAAGALRERLIPKLEERLGTKVRIGGVGVGLSTLTLDTIVIGDEGLAPPITIGKVRARVSLPSLLSGKIKIADVLVEDLRVEAMRGVGGIDNVNSLLDAYKKRAEKKSEGGAGRGRAVSIERVRIVGARLWAADDALGQARVGSVDGTIPWNGTAEISVRDASVDLAAGPRAAIDGMKVRVETREGKPTRLIALDLENGSATPHRALTMTGITGTVRGEAEAEKGDRLTADLKGSYGGAKLPLWNARGWIDPTLRAADLKLRAERFKLAVLDDVLRNPDGSPQLVGAHDAEADASLDLTYEKSVLGFRGAGHLSGLTLAHPGLGPLPVADLGFGAKVDGTLDVAQRILDLKELDIHFRKVHATFAAHVEHLGAKPKVQATLAIDPLPCQHVLDAIPAELTPVLQGFQLAGTFSTDLHFGVDLGDLETPIDLGGKVGIEGCRVTQAPSDYSADKLRNPFEQTVELEPGKWKTFFAGPDNAEWTPFGEISPHLVNSIMTTEDNGFFRHRGFIPSEFRTALQQNLQRGYFRLGASSISMQMVKNVLLSREKTLSRKLQELFLTWYLEKNLSKERILEIYFNVIEFGPGIFGIGHAVRHYFGKEPKDLLPAEAAWFSSILPNPKKRYVQFCHPAGQVDAKWDNYLKRILRRSHERGRLTPAEYQAAIAQPLKFSREEAMPERECMTLVKRLTSPQH